MMWYTKVRLFFQVTYNRRNGDYGDYENLSAYHYFTELYFDTFDFLGTTKYCRELRFSNCFLNGYTHVINAKDFTSLFFDNCLIASDSNTGQPIVNIIKGTAISFNDCNFRSYAQVVYCPNSGLKSLIISGCLFNYFGITGGDAVLADAESNVISNNVFDFSNAQSGVRAIRVYNNAKETSIVSNAFMGSTTHNAVTLDDHDNIKCIGNTFSMTTPVINANGNNVISDDTNTIQFNDGIKLVSKANTEINTLYVGTDGKLYFNDFNGVAHALYT